MVFLDITAVKSLLDETGRMLPKETGGLLMGNKSSSDFFITEIVGPGPKAIHEKYYFKPDDTFHEKGMARIYNSTEGKVTYLGDWHSHPGATAYLSECDKKTLKGISGYEPSQLPQPFMLIVGLFPFEIGLWQYHKKRSFGTSQFKELKISIRF